MFVQFLPQDAKNITRVLSRRDDMYSNRALLLSSFEFPDAYYVDESDTGLEYVAVNRHQVLVAKHSKAGTQRTGISPPALLFPLFPCCSLVLITCSVPS